MVSPPGGKGATWPISPHVCSTAISSELAENSTFELVTSSSSTALSTSSTCHSTSSEYAPPSSAAVGSPGTRCTSQRFGSTGNVHSVESAPGRSQARTSRGSRRSPDRTPPRSSAARQAWPRCASQAGRARLRPGPLATSSRPPPCLHHGATRAGTVWKLDQPRYPQATLSGP